MSQEEQEARQLTAQARALYDAGDMGAALELWARAGTLFNDLGSELEAARCDKVIGLISIMTGQRRKAVECFGRARTVFSSHGAEAETASCDFFIGDELERLGEAREALAHFETAGEVYARLGHEAEAARCHVGIGNTLSTLGQPRRALAHYERAGAVFERLGVEIDIAFYETGIGNVLLTLERPEESLAHHERAREVYRRLGSERDVARCDLNIGNALRALNQPRQAIAHYERAREVYLRISFNEGAADCDSNIGVLLSDLEQRSEALSHHERAKEAYLRLGLKSGAARCDLNIGTVLIALSQHWKALAHFDSAREVYSGLGYEEGVADCEVNIGVTLSSLGQMREAIEHFGRARQVYQRVGVERRVAACDLNIANALDKLGEHLRAIEGFERARETYLRLDSEESVADCERGIGNAARRLRQPQRALEHYKRAKEVCLRLGLGEKVADTDLGLGNALYDLGHLQPALSHYAKAREAYLNLGLRKEAATCDTNTGHIFNKLGQPREAVERFERAREIYRRLSLEVEVAGCDVAIASAARGLREPEEALEHYRSAREVFLRFGLERETATCDVNIGLILNYTGRPEEVVDYYERAREIYARLGLEKELADCECMLGTSFIALSNPEQALTHFKQAKEVYARLGLKKEAAACDIGIGGIHLFFCRTAEASSGYTYEEALTHFDAAIRVTETLRANISDVGLRVSFFEQHVSEYEYSVVCLLHLGRITDALQYLERSRAKVLAEIASGNLMPDRAQIDEELYEAFVGARNSLFRFGLLPTAGRDDVSEIVPYEQGYEHTTHMQARRDYEAVVERIAEQFPHSAFARQLRTTEVCYLDGVAEYVDLLPDERSCLLEFLTWSEDGRLRAFLVTKQRGLELLTFPAESIARLRDLCVRWAEIYRAQVSVKEKAALVWEACRGAHDLIFNAEVEISSEESGEPGVARDRRRLLDHLNETLEQGGEQRSRRMYLIPHSFLFLLPLHAACYGGGASEVCEGVESDRQSRLRYLLAEYLIIYSPSAYLLKISQQRQYPKPQRPRAMVVGNPLPVPGAPPLDYATKEAKVVAGQLAGAGWVVDTLIEAQATKQRFLNGDAKAGVAGVNNGGYYHLHLAQHAGLEGDQAYLCFGREPGATDPEQYLCSSSHIAAAPLHETRSVIAAACLTSFSALLNEYLGMGAAFLQAGVGTYIGTIYPLSDIGSSLLVPQLYRLHLEEGLSWADALRRAQLMMAGLHVDDMSPSMCYPPASGADAGFVKKLSDFAEGDAPSTNHPYHWAAFNISGME